MNMFEHDIIVITSNGETERSLDSLVGISVWDFIEQELDTIMNEINEIDDEI